jgi:putative membrane protein
MAGLLYLPRIFVYHTETKDNKDQSATFKLMEKRLFNYIMMPAMIFSWIFGLLLIHSLGFAIFSQLWMQVKVVLILILTHYHFYLGKCVRLFYNDQNNKTSRFYRIMNEVPTVLLIIIIFLVVFKPL